MQKIKFCQVGGNQEFGQFFWGSLGSEVTLDIWVPTMSTIVYT